MQKRNRLTLGLGVIGAASIFAVGGVYAVFTDAVSVDPQTISTGTVALALADGSDSTPPVEFTQSIPGLGSGDTAYRALILKNTGTLPLENATVSATAAPVNALATTPIATGLAISVDACSQPWTIPSPTVAPTCDGTTTAVRAPVNIAALASPATITGGVVAPGDSTYLMFKYALNANSGAAVEGLTTDVVYTFTGIQRNGAINSE